MRWFIADASAITDIDYSAARTIRDLLDDLARDGVGMVFARVSPYLRADLDRHGISAVVGEARIFSTLHEAIAETGRTLQGLESQLGCCGVTVNGRAREAHVIGRLVATGALTQAQASQALAVPVSVMLAHGGQGCGA